MTLTKEQVDEMKEAAKPIMKFLNENCHPHVKVIVDFVSAEIVEGVATVRTEEFVKDKEE